MWVSTEKVALCCERQGAWKEAAKWHAYERNQYKSYDQALLILDTKFGSANHEVVELRIDIARRACDDARAKGEIKKNSDGTTDWILF